jgi:hypothetical protein
VPVTVPVFVTVLVCDCGVGDIAVVPVMEGVTDTDGLIVGDTDPLTETDTDALTEDDSLFVAEGVTDSPRDGVRDFVSVRDVDTEPE